VVGGRHELVAGGEAQVHTARLLGYQCSICLIQYFTIFTFCKSIHRDCYLTACSVFICQYYVSVACDEQSVTVEVVPTGSGPVSNMARGFIRSFKAINHYMTFRL
jgi:hypothetical protein